MRTLAKGLGQDSVAMQRHIRLAFNATIYGDGCIRKECVIVVKGKTQGTIRPVLHPQQFMYS